MDWLDELNTSTHIDIVPGVTDNVFLNDPVLAMFRSQRLEMFKGGSKIQENFLYAPMDGGAYAKGDSFSLDRRQTVTGGQFDPKFYHINVTEFKEDIQVFNKGSEALFKLVDVDMQNAALTMSAMLAVDLYQDGQGTRSLHMNGLAEILNDGVNNSWSGSTYTTYGQVTRNGTIGAALNSPMTLPAANVAGPLSYKLLEEAWSSVVIGPEAPNMIATTNLGMSYIKEKFHPQLRIETQDPKIGFNSIMFNSSRIFASQYCPGTRGTNDPVLGNYYTAAGEVLWMLNTKFFRFWVTDDTEFGFGFTGFKPAQDNTQVAGQYLFAGNMTCQSPRLSRHFFGITG